MPCVSINNHTILITRGLDGSNLVTAVGINRDFCCWQADVNQVRSGQVSSWSSVKRQGIYFSLIGKNLDM